MTIFSNFTTTAKSLDYPGSLDNTQYANSICFVVVAVVVAVAVVVVSI